MRPVLLALCLAGPLAAQPALFPNGTAPRRVAAPHWRVASGGALTAKALSAIAVVDVERSWRGLVSAGGRAWALAGSGFVDDGPSVSGGGGEAAVSVGTRDRFLDLRATVGLGLAAVDYRTSGFGCEFSGTCGSERRLSSGLRPYASVGVGVDAYVLPGVGVGIAARPVWMRGPANVSTAEVGLRVRLAR